MWRTLMIGSLLGLMSGCSGLPFGQSSDHPDYSAEGKASYYGAKHHGKRTASGERFDQNQLTAAHRILPFGSRVRVTNLNNDKACWSASTTAALTPVAVSSTSRKKPPSNSTCCAQASSRCG